MEVEMVWKTKAEKLADQKLKEQEVDQELGQPEVRATTQELEAKAAKPKKVNELEDEYTLETINDYDPSADIFRIPKKDPSYAYRFLKDEKENLSIKTGNLLHQKGGWQLCPRSHVQRIGVAEMLISPDGFYRVGGLVLAFMPKHLFEKKEAVKQEKTDARMKTINRFLKEGDSSVGGKEIHKSMKGIQPAHKLGMGSKED